MRTGCRLTPVSGPSISTYKVVIIIGTYTSVILLGNYYYA